MQDEPDNFERVRTSVYHRDHGPLQADPPAKLMWLFRECCSMYEARWGSISRPDGLVFRNFTRASRPGFGPRFASGSNAAPKPAETGLEVSIERDNWLLELVFDDFALDYADIAERMSKLIDRWNHRE